MANESVKRWRHVSWERIGDRVVMKFRGQVLTSKWVKFTQPWEDGYGIYDEGQISEILDPEKLAFYLEEGRCLPCAPPAAKTDKMAQAPLGVYQFLDSVVIGNKGYAPGHEYVMPQPRGDKYVERGIAVKVRDYKVQHGDERQPENAMRRGSK